MNDEQRPPAPDEAVRFAETAESPAPGEPNTLVFRVLVGHPPAAPLLTLHGAFNIAVDIAGRYSGRMPMPVRLVAVSRDTGRVHMRTLTRLEDLPPVYQGAVAPPSVTRTGTGKAPARPITEFGHFSVDIKRHLNLPDAGGRYDVFLWLEHILSERVTVEKPAEPGKAPGAAEFGKSARLAETRTLPPEADPALALAWAESRSGPQLAGQGGPGPVSVIAHAPQSGETAWIALPGSGTQPIGFKIALNRLLPGALRHERVLALAVSGGRLTALQDSARAR